MRAPGQLVRDRELRLLLVATAWLAVRLAVIAHPLPPLGPFDAHDFGRRMLGGGVPYIDLPLEYPPLSVLAFVIPGLVPSGVADSVLGLQALGAELAVIALVLRHRPDALRRYLVCSAVVFPLMAGGFDALPMAALAISTAALIDGKPWGWWVAGLGATVKLVPGSAWLWARSHRYTAVVALTVTIAVLLTPVLLVGLSRDSYAGYALKRGVQMESVGASLTWMLQRLQGHASLFESRFGAIELHGADGAATFATASSLVALALLWRRARALDPWLASFGAVILVLAGSKVLSPQFVVWPAPLAAVLGGRWFRWYLLLVGTTTLAYLLPGYSTDVPFLVVTFIRNLVLLGCAGDIVRELLHPRPHPVDLAAEGVEIT